MQKPHYKFMGGFQCILFPSSIAVLNPILLSYVVVKSAQLEISQTSTVKNFKLSNFRRRKNNLSGCRKNVQQGHNYIQQNNFQFFREKIIKTDFLSFGIYALTLVFLINRGQIFYSFIFLVKLLRIFKKPKSSQINLYNNNSREREYIYCIRVSVFLNPVIMVENICTLILAVHTILPHFKANFPL